MIPWCMIFRDISTQKTYICQIHRLKTAVRIQRSAVSIGQYNVLLVFCNANLFKYTVSIIHNGN